jgi:hypothetical protein
MAPVIHTAVINAWMEPEQRRAVLDVHRSVLDTGRRSYLLCHNAEARAAMLKKYPELEPKHVLVSSE